MSWSDIPGWFDWQWLYDEAVDTAPVGGTIVEVGVAFGRSLAYLARRALDAKRQDLRLVGVDPWQDDYKPDGWPEEQRPTWGGEHAVWARAQGGPFSAFIASMREHAPKELERVSIFRGTSEELAGALRGALDRKLVHLAFIDADHRYEAVCADARLWKDATILAGHDYHSADFPGVVRAVDEMFPDRIVRGTTWRRA